MIFTGNREESFVCRRVTFPDFKEREDYAFTVSGKLSLSALSDTRASGTLDFTGTEQPLSGSLLRIYYKGRDDVGGEAFEPLATMFAKVSGVTVDGSVVSGSAELSSVLSVAAADCYGRAYTVSKGTNAVAKARAIIEGLGLKTNRPASSYTLRSELNFEPGDSWLKIANALLAAAGYAACAVDGYGTVIMVPYENPDARTPIWDFETGELSIMEPEVAVSDDAGDIPNKVKLVFEDEDASLWACAENIDPTHAASVQSVGYAVTVFESVSELDGATPAARLSNLKAQAAKMLADKTQAVEYVEFSHPWVPVSPADSITVTYQEAGIKWRGVVTSMEIEVGAHISVTTRARRFVRADFACRTEGGAW